jgi:cytochrome c5
MIGLGVLAIILVFTAINLTSDMSEYKPQEIVLENIKPVGQVNVAGEGGGDAPADTAAAAADAEPAAPRSGEVVYNTACMSCHATGAAGAPKVGDAAAWAARIGAGMDTLMANATNGLNAMPPMGLCMDCSGEELQAAVQYMVDNSQ